MPVALILCLISLAAQFYSLFLNQGFFPYLGPFDLDNGIQVLDVRLEMSVPNAFSSAVLLLCSVLFAGIAFSVRRTGHRYALRWGALSVVLFFVYVDEAIEIHDRLARLLASLGNSGLFHYAWYILAGAFVVVFALAYLPFLFNLPVQTRRLFILAGTAYVSGVLGLDLLEDIIGLELQAGLFSPTSIVIGTIEEFMEMTGAVLLLYALMRYTSHLEQAGE